MTIKELAGFSKTRLIPPGESDTVVVSFPIEYFSCFDDSYPASVIPQGDYIIRVGTSSRETKVEAVLTVPETVIREKYDRILEDDGRFTFEDMKNPGTGKEGRHAIDEAQIAACERKSVLNLSLEFSLWQIYTIKKKRTMKGLFKKLLERLDYFNCDESDIYEYSYQTGVKRVLHPILANTKRTIFLIKNIL